MIRLKLAAAASMAAFALGATPAGAASVFHPDGSVTVDADDVGFNWLVNTDSSMPGSDGLLGQLYFELTDVDGDGEVFKFDYYVKNTSVGDATASRLGQFGFNVTGMPDLTDNPSDFFQLGTKGNFNGLRYDDAKGRDFCFFVGSGCNGAANDGLLPGVISHGSFTLTYGSRQTGLLFEGFVTRWQAGVGGVSASGEGPAIPIIPVPEPAAWAMMIAGFGMVGGALRSRRRASLATA